MTARIENPLVRLTFSNFALSTSATSLIIVDFDPSSKLLAVQNLQDSTPT